MASPARPVLPDDPAYSRLWQIVNKNNRNMYDGYQKKQQGRFPSSC